MTGANRPPWVDIQDFYRMPFNYCDRWCEKCRLDGICRIFQDEEKSKKEWMAAGKDPNSWEYTFETIGKSLMESFALLARMAKKEGINIENIDYEEEKEQPSPGAFKIYRLAQKLRDAIEKILSDLQVVPAEADQELILKNADILSFYSTLIPSKVYRAVTSKFREEKDPLMKEICGDSRISAFIVVNAFDEIIRALIELIVHPPLRPMREKLIKFKKAAINLKEMVNMEFEVEEEEKVN